jgi:nucleotide-binding universal stress UspA family protein
VFQHILLTTDFSETSERAIEVAAGVARALRSRVTVVHVIETSGAASPASALAAERTWPRALRARAEVDRTVDRLRARGVQADGVLRFGLLPEPVVEVARELGADLVVAGTHARKGAARLWHGSVAEELQRHSPVPFLAVVPRAAAGRADGEGEARVPANVVELRRR